MKRLIAIDYGLKRVGVAVTDPMQILASPLITLQNDGKLIDGIKKILTEQDADTVILGYPLKENGSFTDITGAVLRFKQVLEQQLKIAVVLVDERYSSAIASDRVLQSVPKKSKRRDKSLIDKNAAAVILEDYLRSLKP